MGEGTVRNRLDFILCLSLQIKELEGLFYSKNGGDRKTTNNLLWRWRQRRFKFSILPLSAVLLLQERMPVFGDDIDPLDWDEAGQCCLNLVQGRHSSKIPHLLLRAAHAGDQLKVWWGEVKDQTQQK